MTRKAQERTQARSRVRVRIREKVHGSAERPRLAIFKSGKHIYAQVIDDSSGRTVAQASSLDSDVKAKGKAGANVAMAGRVGELVAHRAKEKGVARVVFDRGGYIYHGKVRALADAARKGGLEF
jgi:large subunit ribosomal protein L18